MKKKEAIEDYQVGESMLRIYSQNRKEFAGSNGTDPPKGFERFIRSPLCKELCESILDYCKYLIKLDRKKKDLEADALKRKLPPPVVLRSELDRLNKKAKRMGDNYGKTLFAHRSIGATEDGAEEKCHSYLTFKSAIYSNQDNDNAFYKSLTRLMTKTLLECFERTEIPIVEKEIERVFKTNVFNSSERS